MNEKEKFIKNRKAWLIEKLNAKVMSEDELDSLAEFVSPTPKDNEGARRHILNMEVDFIKWQREREANQKNHPDPEPVTVMSDEEIDEIGEKLW